MRRFEINHIDHESTVTFILGAGFSMDAKLPSQDGISKQLLSSDGLASSRDLAVADSIRDFLVYAFGWEEGLSTPTLEDLFTCIELSASNGPKLGKAYPPKKLRSLRKMLNYRIMSILNKRYDRSEDIELLLRNFLGDEYLGTNCNFVVLNWDIVLEKHLSNVVRQCVIDYRIPYSDWYTLKTNPVGTGIPVCKMHGSSNWVFCDRCKKILADITDKLALTLRAGLTKSDFSILGKDRSDLDIDMQLQKCESCGYPISPHNETFSFKKNLNKKSYKEIWRSAKNFLANSDHWIFIGYSLPEADYEFKHLMKVAQLQRSSFAVGQRQIDVITKDDWKAYQKYGCFFGNNEINFYNGGLSDYVMDLEHN